MKNVFQIVLLAWVLAGGVVLAKAQDVPRVGGGPTLDRLKIPDLQNPFSGFGARGVVNFSRVLGIDAPSTTVTSELPKRILLLASTSAK